MDVDRSLDDLIADKKSSQPQRGGRGRGGGVPRSNSGRAGQIPYARPPPRSTDDTWVHDAYQAPAGGRRVASGPPNGAGPAGTGAGFTGISPRIEVVGLHYEVSQQDLKNIFSQAGTLVQGPTIRTLKMGHNGKHLDQCELSLCSVFVLLIAYDRSGRSKGEATMEFASYQQARIAINKFDGAMTKGQTISIRLLPPPRAQPPAARQGAQTGASLLQRMSGSGPARGAPRGAASGPRGGRGRGGPANRGRRGPANAGDLDKELDKFMTTTNGNAGDVDMA